MDELARREQELDDREHKHARRNLREQITRTFNQRMAEPVVSSRASRIRWTVFLLTLCTGTGLGWLGFATLAGLATYEGGLSDWAAITRKMHEGGGWRTHWRRTARISGYWRNWT